MLSKVGYGSRLKRTDNRGFVARGILPEYCPNRVIMLFFAGADLYGTDSRK